MSLRTSGRRTLGDRWRWAWLLGLLAMAAVYPALIWNSGAVAYDAALQHIYRGLVFSGAINDGVLYPRWVQFLHLGLGSPLFTFQGPLPYYAMDLLYRLGLPHPLGWRVLIGAGLLAGSIGAYLLVFSLTSKRWPAVVGAVAFLYAPYVLRNALERGSNEAYSLFLYPWVVWGLIWLARRPAFGRFLLVTLVWAACIACHVLGPLMLAPVAFTAAVVAGWRHRTIMPLLALVAGGLLTAFIWAPMVPEQAWVQVERDFNHPDALPWNHPIPLNELLAPPAVYDELGGNNDTGNRVGLIQTGMLLLAAPAAVYAWRTRRRRLSLYLVLAAGSALLVFWLFTESASSAWRLVAPVLGRVQYRSRLMGLQSLWAGVTAGLVIAAVPTRWQRPAAIGLSLALALVALSSLYIDLRHQYAPFDTNVTWDQVRDTEIALGGSALTAYSEFTPRARSAPFDDKLLDEIGRRFDPEQAPLAPPSDGVTVRSAQVKASNWDVTIDARGPTTLTFHLLYYPRWQARIDGQPAKLRAQAETGYVQLDFPAGTHRVTFDYATTTAERIGLVLSGLTLAGLCLFGACRRQALRRPSAASLPATGGTAGLEKAPSLALLWLLTGLLAFKVLYVDGHTTWLRCVSTSEQVCGAEVTADASFAGGMRLRGYSVSGSKSGDWGFPNRGALTSDGEAVTVSPGDSLALEFFWQAGRRMDAGQYMFIHLRNSRPDMPKNPETGNEIWVDVTVEGPGGFFNTSYEPGRIYRDVRRLPVPESVPPGEYTLEVGWLDVATGEQIEPVSATIRPPLRELWRSLGLATVQVK